MARFAYGVSHATAALGVFGASGLGNSVAVGAAALVVVVTIVLVFVMVLRSNGASKRTASGLGYDAQQGPIGQPHPEGGANASSWQRQGDMAGAGPMGQMAAPSAGRASGSGWGQTQDYGAGAFGGGAPAAQGGWGAGAAAGGWDAPAAPGQASPQSGANPWGIANNGAAAQQADQWGAPRGGGWDAAPGAPGRPAANAGGWDAPVAQGPAAGAAGGFGGGWGAPGGQPAQGTNAGAGQWGAADAGASWGAPAQAAPAPTSGGGWGAGMGQPQPASGAGWGAEWGAPAQATPSPAAMPQGYGEVDKTHVVRPAAGAQSPGMLVVRQGKEPGRVFEARKDRLTIGRSRESDIFLEDLAVSRLHTTVSRDEYGRYILRDENSANGTYVNGQRVSEHVLEEGDEIQVGQSVLAFVRR